MEWKRENLEIHPDKDIAAFVALKSNRQQKIARLKIKFAEYRKNKLASRSLSNQSSLALMKLTESEIAKLLLSLGWNYESVKAYAQANGFEQPSDTEIFWGGFIAGGISYEIKRQEYLREIEAKKKAFNI